MPDVTYRHTATKLVVNNKVNRTMYTIRHSKKSGLYSLLMDNAYCVTVDCKKLTLDEVITAISKYPYDYKYQQDEVSTDIIVRAIKRWISEYKGDK